MADINGENKFEPVVKIEDYNKNPWSVEDASIFLKYCCPECDFKNEDLSEFSSHAVFNHKNASVLFYEANNFKYTSHIILQCRVIPHAPKV